MGTNGRINPSWIVVPLMLALMAGSAWGGATLLVRDPRAQVADGTGSGEIANAAAHSSGGLTTEPTEPTDPAPTASVAPVADCWDGSTASTVAACPLPTGIRGLEHVFPSFHHAQCNDVRAQHPELDHPQMWECFGTVDGQPITVAYDQVDRVDNATTYYDQAFADGYRELRRDGDGVPLRYAWTSNAEYPARLTSLYLGYPYAVSVFAPTLEVAREAWWSVVRFRTGATLLGTMRPQPLTG